MSSDFSSSPSRGFAGRLLLLWLAVFTVLAIRHRDVIFVAPWHEFADYAVDALKIERARHFDIIHGNYSRFGFYHPGPAFYYVYAAGEQVFYRWLHWLPSPHNAHMLAGLLLQSLFFSAALAMAAAWIRRPLFLPLALALSAIHFTLAGNAFVDTWPPRVLLMPFLCFVVGAASVSCGRMRDLPFTVLAACFLAHGHVAQPLFLLPIFTLACGVAWWRGRQSPQAHRPWSSPHRVAYAVSIGCILLFLVPLALDLRQGSESNLARILEFESYDYPGKPFWKSLVYFCAFFGYVRKTEFFVSAWGPDRASVIGEHVAGYFVWGVVVVAVLVQAWRLRVRPASTERQYTLALTGFTAFAFLLTLAWGMKQTGRMFEFNGYLNYGILDCILLLLCIAISAWRVARPALIGLFLCSVAVASTWLDWSEPPALDPTTILIPPAVDRVLAADPQSASPKYLVFPHAEWSAAISLGLALRRSGHDFVADGLWGHYFVPDGAFEPTPPDFAFPGLSIWRLSRSGPRDLGLPLREDLRVYLQPLPLDPTTAEIDCSVGGNLELYSLFGFDSAFGPGAWTNRPHAGLVFATSPAAQDIAVTIEASPFLVPGKIDEQPMSLSVNGITVSHDTLRAPGSVVARVPRSVWNRRSPVTLVLNLPSAISPRTLGRSLDYRLLAWQVTKITFRPAP